MSTDSDGTREVAVITGATAGIGYESAKALASRGADIGVLSRTEADCADVAAELEAEYGVDAIALPCDVGDEAAVEDAIDEVIAELGRLDVLVNNAGIEVGGGVPVADVTTADYRAMMRTNVDGVFFTTRAALPHLTETAGTLVFIGSFAGQYPRPEIPVYAASKAWVRNFALSVEASAGTEDVAVSLINPAEVRTAMWRDTYDEGEITEPAEVARAVAFVTTFDNSTVSELDLYRRDKLSDMP